MYGIVILRGLGAAPCPRRLDLPRSAVVLAAAALCQRERHSQSDFLKYCFIYL